MKKIILLIVFLLSLFFYTSRSVKVFACAPNEEYYCTETLAGVTVCGCYPNGSGGCPSGTIVCATYGCCVVGSNPGGCGGTWSAWSPFVCCPGDTQERSNICGVTQTRACTQPLTASCCGDWGAWGTCFGGCGGPGAGIQFREDNCGYSQSKACNLPVCPTSPPGATSTPRPPTLPPGGPTSTPRPPTSTPTPSPTLTPTPSPTPVPGSWIKLKNSSFISSNNLNNRIPGSPAIYDTDDTLDPYFIIGSGGVVMAPVVNLGTNTGVKSGFPEYKATYGLRSDGMSPGKFLSYIKSRKAHKQISSLDQIDGNGIYNYSGATLDIDSISPKLNQFKTVILVTGTININTNLNGASFKSLALLATNTINFSSTVSEANGIFVASTVNTGTTINQGLKINGNLISESSLSNDRKQANPNIPSLFIVFKPNIYIDLLPYLSTVNYEWQQRQ